MITINEDLAAKREKCARRRGACNASILNDMTINTTCGPCYLLRLPRLQGVWCLIVGDFLLRLRAVSRPLKPRGDRFSRRWKTSPTARRLSVDDMPVDG